MNKDMLENMSNLSVEDQIKMLDQIAPVIEMMAPGFTKLLDEAKTKAAAGDMDGVLEVLLEMFKTVQVPGLDVNVMSEKLAKTFASMGVDMPDDVLNKIKDLDKEDVEATTEIEIH